MIAVQTKSLIKSYKTPHGYETMALNRLDMTVESGEFIGIMGPSGSGKTTLLNLIGTLDTSTSGNIVIDDQDITQLSRDELVKFRRDKLGFIFQDFNLLDNLTVQENIIFPLLISDSVKTSTTEKVRDIAKILAITDILEKYPYQVSGGQKQRTAVARAIVKGPSLILADEPSGNLDYNSARNLVGYLASINRIYRSTIIMVTHDPAMASYCDRVLFLKDGEIVSQLAKDPNRDDFYPRVMSMIMSLEGENSGLPASSI